MAIQTITPKAEQTAHDASKGMRLENLTAQASSLSVLLYGNGREAFQSLFPHDQDNILWLLSDLLHEMDGIVNGRSA